MSVSVGLGPVWGLVLAGFMQCFMHWRACSCRNSWYGRTVYEEISGLLAGVMGISLETYLRMAMHGRTVWSIDSAARAASGSGARIRAASGTRCVAPAGTLVPPPEQVTWCVSRRYAPGPSSVEYERVPFAYGASEQRGVRVVVVVAESVWCGRPASCDRSGTLSLIGGVYRLANGGPFSVPPQGATESE